MFERHHKTCQKSRFLSSRLSNLLLDIVVSLVLISFGFAFPICVPVILGIRPVLLISIFLNIYKRFTLKETLFQREGSPQNDQVPSLTIALRLLLLHPRESHRQDLDTWGVLKMVMNLMMMMAFMNIITLGHFEGSNILGQDVSGKHLYKSRPNYLGTAQIAFDQLPPL